MIGNKKILVFVPVYNCDQHVSFLLDQLSSPSITQIVDKVLIVNNRSTDQTESVILAKLKSTPNMPVVLVRNGQNYGLGGSHKVAFNFAIENSFDYVIVLHGDNQATIQDIMLPLKNFITQDKNDCLLGARFHKSSRLEGYSLIRRFGNKFFNVLFSWATKNKIYDLGSGLNCYKVNSLKDKYYNHFPDDLTFNYCMILAHSFHRHRTEFFPLVWSESGQVSNVKLFSQARKVLKMLVEFVLNKKVLVEKDYRVLKRSNYPYEVIFE